LKKFLFLATAAILNGGRGCQDIILKGTHLGTIPARFGLIWFSGFREEDLNVIFANFNCSYMAMSSLRYIPGFSVKYFFQPIYTDYAN
jgi:hypothetical protein